MQAFLTALIQRSVSMSALALVLLALSPLLARRCASKWLYGAWMVIVAGLVVPFRLPTRTVQIRAEAVPAAVRPIFSAGSGTAPAAVSAVAPAVSADPAVPWDRLAGALWIAGVAAFLLYHGLRHARFLGMVKRWSEPAQGKILKVLEASEREMGIAGRIGLRICPCVSSPMVTGFRNAVILLPRSDFSEEELKYILRHELVHFRRKDLWLRGLVVLAAAVHWFNPMVYLIAKAAALQCELSCDAAVVDGIGPEGRRKYGEVLLGAVKSRPKARTAFSSNFYSGKKGMKKRIFAILDTRKKKSRNPRPLSDSPRDFGNRHGGRRRRAGNRRPECFPDGFFQRTPHSCREMGRGGQKPRRKGPVRPAEPEMPGRRIRRIQRRPLVDRHLQPVGGKL